MTHRRDFLLAKDKYVVLLHPVEERSNWTGRSNYVVTTSPKVLPYGEKYNKE